MFVSEFAVDGTTFSEALGYQKGWKELCEANLLLNELGGMGYAGFYKGFQFCIGEYGGYLPFNSELPILPSGILDMTFGSFKNTEEIFKILRLDCEPIEEGFLEQCFGDYGTIMD